MSDDEEVVCKGKELYSHLISQGYSDFGTFDLAANKNFVHHRLANNVDNDTIHDASKNSRLNITSKTAQVISSSEYDQLEILLRSKLLLEEDADCIAAGVEHLIVQKPTSKLFWYLSTLAGFISSLALSKVGRSNLIYLPFGFSFGIATYSLWSHFKESAELQRCRKLRFHICLLQNLCSNIQKIYRLLKETEVLSGGKIKFKNLSMPIDLYIPKTQPNSTSLGTQPHLRKCLLDSMLEVVTILSFACNVLHKTGLLPPEIAANEKDHFPESPKFKAETDSDRLISLKELQVVNEKYLVLQSEYLKLVSFLVCPRLLTTSPKVKENIHEVYSLCETLESDLRVISFRLQMQYNINNIFLPTEKSGFLKCININSNELNHLLIDVHNIFLLLLSMLLRVKNVEDVLETVSSNLLPENQNEIKALILKQLSTLKDDLTSTSKCFDFINQQIFYDGVSNRKTQPTPEKLTEDVSSTDSASKRTGVIVGASDFNVNRPDEVFLAISGLCSEEHQPDDDWLYEKIPPIPINLLSELSDRLKEIRENFTKREKAAIERQGLIDFSEKHSGCEGEGSKNYSFRHQKKTKALPILSDASDSSDSENNCAVTKKSSKKIKQGKKHCVYVESNDSETDDDNTLSRNSLIGLASNQTHSSLANLAAMKSQLWGKTAEECFSDG